jgi:hypothetical protein
MQTFPLVKLKENITSVLAWQYLPHFFANGPYLSGPYLHPVPDLHLHMTLLDRFHAMPSSSKHSAISMGRYHFYEESPNEYSFTNEDL